MIRRLYESLLRAFGRRALPLLRGLALLAPRRENFAVDEAEDFIEVHDRGADVTVFAFAGMAALHGGMVGYEFRRLLASSGSRYNLVFIRDIRCAGYHYSPTGGHDGLRFYQAAVGETMERLGAARNVALGTSVGAAAALTFGARCSMDLVLAFSPTWPPELYRIDWRPRAWTGHLALILRSPGAFFERLMLARMGGVSHRVLEQTIGLTAITDPLEDYRREGAPEQTCIYYAKGFAADAGSAERFREEPGVELVALPGERHNTTGQLKRAGKLGSEIISRIEASRPGRVSIFEAAE